MEDNFFKIHDNFMTKCLTGQSKGDDMDDYVDLWHKEPKNDPEIPLHEYLGMTWEQYGRWVKDPDEMSNIIEECRLVMTEQYMEHRKVVQKALEDDFLGLTLEEGTKEANKRGLNEIRLTSIDGKGQKVTYDHCFSRMNFAVQDNIITKVHIG